MYSSVVLAGTHQGSRRWLTHRWTYESPPPQGTLSSAGTRTPDLPGPLLDEMSRHVEAQVLADPDDLVFADRFGGPLRRSNFRRRIFDPAVEMTGLDGLTFHGLRHSAATVWMASGADPLSVRVR